MLSSVLRSKRAISVNIAIMRAFVRLRKILASHAELARKLSLGLRTQFCFWAQSSSLITYSEAIRQLMAPKEGPNKRIGFHLREKRTVYSARG